MCPIGDAGDAAVRTGKSQQINGVQKREIAPKHEATYFYELGIDSYAKGEYGNALKHFNLAIDMSKGNVNIPQQMYKRMIVAQTRAAAMIARVGPSDDRLLDTPQRKTAYETAQSQYQKGIECINKGDYSTALKHFDLAKNTLRMINLQRSQLMARIEFNRAKTDAMMPRG